MGHEDVIPPDEYDFKQSSVLGARNGDSPMSTRGSARSDMPLAR